MKYPLPITVYLKYFSERQKVAILITYKIDTMSHKDVGTYFNKFKDFDSHRRFIEPSLKKNIGR